MRVVFSCVTLMCGTVADRSVRGQLEQERWSIGGKMILEVGATTGCPCWVEGEASFRC
jgi:hypothetical protein